MLFIKKAAKKAEEAEERLCNQCLQCVLSILTDPSSYSHMANAIPEATTPEQTDLHSLS